MRVIGVVSRKGGSGKSTIAAHLSVLANTEGKPALLIDVDPQGSLRFWHSLRDAETPVLVEAEAKELQAILKDAQADGIDWVFIDSMPHNDAGIARVVEASDLCLIPTRPSAFDLAAVSATIDLVSANGRTGMVVLNSAPPKRTLESSTVSEARKVLDAMGAKTWGGQITQRAAFAHAITSGSAVSEFEPGGAADREIADLWDAVQKEA